MDYKHDQSLDKGNLPLWVLRIINRATNRIPGRPAFSLTGTSLFIPGQETVYDDVDNLFNTIIIDQSGTHSNVYGQITPEPDGSNVTFQGSKADPILNTIVVFLNGQLLTQGTGKDYLVNSDGSWTMDVAPTGVDKLLMLSQTESSSNNLIIAQVNGTDSSYNKFVEIPNGGRVDFTLVTGPFIAKTMRLFLNGMAQYEGSSNDFTIFEDLAQVKFDTAPLTNAVIGAIAQSKDIIQVDQTGSFANSKYGVIVGAIPGSTYNTKWPYRKGSLSVANRGQTLTLGGYEKNDWYESNPLTGEFKLNTASILGDIFTGSYLRDNRITQRDDHWAYSAITASTYTIDHDDKVLELDGTSNTVTATLPSAVGMKGQRYYISCSNDDNAVAVATSGSETINEDSSNFALILDESIIIISNGTGWRTF